MTVIAMTREMGSRGNEVALALAQRLDLELVHPEVVEHHLADRLHVEESAVHRYLEGDPGVLDRLRIDRKALALCTAEEIFELAERGNVLIRGWGATRLLRAVSHVLCVRVCAPLEARVATLMARIGLDDAEQATREIAASDAAHTRVVKRLAQGDWRDASVYDLVLNTARVPIERCVGLVHELVTDPAFAETRQSRSLLSDLRRQARAARLLREGGSTSIPASEAPLAPGLRTERRHAGHDERPERREDRDPFPY